jgi:hypothetical protein
MSIALRARLRFSPVVERSSQRGIVRDQLGDGEEGVDRDDRCIAERYTARGFLRHPDRNQQASMG